MVVSVEIKLSFNKVEKNLAKWTQIWYLHYYSMTKNENCTGLYTLTILINSYDMITHNYNRTPRIRLLGITNLMNCDFFSV